MAVSFDKGRRHVTGPQRKPGEKGRPTSVWVRRPGPNDRLVDYVKPVACPNRMSADPVGDAVHHAARSGEVPGGRTGRVVRPTLGDRNRLRPIRDEPADSRAALQDAGGSREGTGDVGVGVQPGSAGDAGGVASSACAGGTDQLGGYGPMAGPGDGVWCSTAAETAGESAPPEPGGNAGPRSKTCSTNHAGKCGNDWKMRATQPNFVPFGTGTFLIEVFNENTLLKKVTVPFSTAC